MAHGLRRVFFNFVVGFVPESPGIIVKHLVDSLVPSRRMVSMPSSMMVFITGYPVLLDLLVRVFMSAGRGFHQLKMSSTLTVLITGYAMMLGSLVPRDDTPAIY